MGCVWNQYGSASVLRPVAAAGALARVFPESWKRARHLPGFCKEDGAFLARAKAQLFLAAAGLELGITPG
eukprot:6101301-Lingulodinium_polyedra.AAC.1